MGNITDVADDVLMDILSRLRVKFVLRCRAVCKPWNSLLSDPRFTKLHFNKSSRRPPNLLLEGFSEDKFQTLDTELLEEVEALGFTRQPPLGVTVVGCCNGLVCLWNGSCSMKKTLVSLWNPSTGEHFVLPRVYQTNSSCSIGYSSSCVSPGFGYNPVVDEYKVVLVTKFANWSTETVQVRLYTVGAETWRKVKVAQSPTGDILNPKGTYVDGVLYWIRKTNGVLSIFSFDLNNEKFGAVQLPKNLGVVSMHDLDFAVDLGVLKGCLMVRRWSRFADRFDIWVMKAYGVEETWVKLFSFEKPSSHLRRDGSYWLIDPLFIMKNGNILLQVNGRTECLCLYDPVAETHRRLTVRGIPKTFWAYNYVEALTSIAGLKLQKTVG